MSTAHGGRTLSFAADIRPLFRDRDVLAMSFIIDLTSYVEVSENVADIVNRIADQTMPCDSPWTSEKLGLFMAWVEGGMGP